MADLDFSLIGWVVLALSAVMVGVSKTSIGGFGAIAVAGFALFMPAKLSTAAVLLLLITGDLIAVGIYRRAADWAMLRRLLPAVLPGIVGGAIVMRFIDDRTMIVIIAATLLVALLLQFALRLRPSTSLPAGPPRPVATLVAGGAAGFSTMVANAAAPVMALYLLAARVEKLRFVGTNAWFFLLVNVSKVPFAAGLGLLPTSTLVLTALLIPGVVAGAWLGRRLLARLDQTRFEMLTVGASVVATLALLLRALV